MKDNSHVDNILKLVIVTPMRNEALKIPLISQRIANLQSNFPIIWIAVDDNSEDGTLEVISTLDSSKPDVTLSAKTTGKLISGGAFKAWFVGVSYSIDNIPNFTHLMKLDADVELDDSYFSSMHEFMLDPSIGLLGGVLQNSSREQSIHVPGPVKLYSRAALDCVLSLPLETGFDVMDEVLLKKQGFKVMVVQKAKFKINRAIGASQGLIHGRRRNGQVCNWTGYYPPYFLLHTLRYVFRQPFVVGSIAMLYGYLKAPTSPYADDLKKLHSKSQKDLLFAIARSPYRQLITLYSRNK